MCKRPPIKMNDIEPMKRGDKENELEDLDNGRGRDAVVRDYFS